MAKIKNFFRNKGIGFYFSLVAAIVSVVAAIVYSVQYKGSVYMNWGVVVSAVIGAALFIVMCPFKYTSPWAPLPLALADLGSFLIFCRFIYSYLSEAFYGGINAAAFATLKVEFVSSLILLLLSLILSIIGVCLRQNRSQQNVGETEQKTDEMVQEA